MTGRINSLQSLGAVDGPGVRYVVFMQGCPLRCVYCHNPDTWDLSEGKEMSSDELVEKILSCKGYFGKDGGVTVTGGEPLLQADFVAELFEKLRSSGVHTALDTSGCYPQEAENVLKYTSLVLADLKFSDSESYKKYCGADFGKVAEFLALTEKMNIPLWIRHVVVPGLTDSPEQMKKIFITAKKYKNLEHIEWLPFRKLCLEKYKNMGIEFPLEQTPEMKNLSDIIASYGLNY